MPEPAKKASDSQPAKDQSDARLTSSMKPARTEIDHTVIEPTTSWTTAAGLDINRDAATRSTFEVGSLVKNKYEILKVIGQGGMGVVYKARQVTVNKLMAIKRLLVSSGTINDSALRRFQKEATACFKLDHKNIVKVFDFDPNEGDPFLVMEFVEGVALSSLIKSKVRLPIEFTIEIALQLCDGLAHAHGKNVLHRDLKPQNIMIQEPKFSELFGQNEPLRVRILDFGLAKIFDTVTGTAPSLTQEGEAIGTPLYMSPEQCEGKHVDQRSDVYSLGCVIYECLTSHPPFIKDSAVATLIAHIKETPVSLKEASLAEDFSPDIEVFIARMLEKDPSKRHQTILEVQQDLQNLREDKSPIPATQAASKKHPVRNIKRGTLKIIAVLCLLVAIPVVLIVSNLQQQNKSTTVAHVDPFAIPSGAHFPSESSSSPQSNQAGPNSITSSVDGHLKSKCDQSLAAVVDQGQIDDPLRLAGKDLTDEGLLYLTKYENVLNSVDVSHTEITDKGMEYLGKLRGLRILRLNHNQITDDGIRNFTAQYVGPRRKPSPLQVLIAEQNHQITSASMPLLRYLPQLIVLDLNDSGVDDGGLVDLVRAAPYLKELDLSHDNVSDSKLTYCKNLRYLNFIDLSNTQITDQGLGNLGHNALLRSLNVNNTKISDKALSSLLARYTEFNALYLRNDDQISDNVIPALTRLRGLGWLDLRNTRVTNRGLLRLAQVTSLKEIAISGSGITADGINRFKQLNAQARVVDDITQVHDFIWIDGSLKYNLFSKN